MEPACERQHGAGDQRGVERCAVAGNPGEARIVDFDAPILRRGGQGAFCRAVDEPVERRWSHGHRVNHDQIDIATRGDGLHLAGHEQTEARPGRAGKQGG